MTVSCPECQSVFRVDPAKVPATGVRARCSVCGGIIAIAGGTLPVSVTPVATGAIAAGSLAAQAASTVTAAAMPAVSRVRPTPARAVPASPTPARPAPAVSAPGAHVASGATPMAARSVATPIAATPAVKAPLAAPAQPTPAAASPVRATPLRGTPVAAAAHAAPAASGALPAARVTPLRTPALPQAPVAPRTPTPVATGIIPTGAPAGGSPGTPAEGRRPINPFLRADPAQRARRLARALVSDLVAYHPQKREEGLRDGTLRQLFREEIKKSYEEYVEQVGRESAEGAPYFQEALNEILAGGRRLF